MLYTKYQGSSSFFTRVSSFPILIYITQIYPPVRALFYTRGINWYFGRGPGIIPVEFGQISVSGSREEVVFLI